MKFKPEDFIQYEQMPVTSSSKRTIEWMADTANSVLEKHLATLHPVYANINNGCTGAWLDLTSEHDTHTALLWGISEIKKKECEHKNISLFYPTYQHGPMAIAADCLDCNVKLKANWEIA